MDDGSTIRRRRACAECAFRFTTFERVELAPITVSKRGGRREPFDRQKIVHGLLAASKGRPIESETFEALADEVEERARFEGGDVTSDWVGRAVLDRLRLIDQVACLRFASVYKDFTEIADFEREVHLIKLEKTTGGAAPAPS